jgi:hypothetical protein
MGRAEVAELSFQGTWVDGYIPNRSEMKRLARLYREMDTDEGGRPAVYGFGYASAAWSRQDYFNSIASALRDTYHRENVPSGVHTTPCFMWLFATDKEPTAPQAMPLYEEYLADDRRDDYYHLVTIHREECPVADGCLQTLMSDLQFESKPSEAYTALGKFERATHQILTRYVGIIAAPQQEIRKHLQLISGSALFSFT